MVLIDALVVVSSHAPGLALYVKDSRSSEVHCVSSQTLGVSPSSVRTPSYSERAVIFPAFSLRGFFEIALVSTRSNVALLYSSFPVSPIPNPPYHPLIKLS